MKTPHLKNVLLNSAVVCGTLLICLILFEWVARVFHLTPDIFLEPHPVTGVWHIPNKVGLYFHKDIPKTLVQINSAGLHDQEYSLVKPANTYRIAVIGDSYTQAIHVPLEDTYQQRLETSLNTHPPFDARFEVINFGIGGFGTSQEYIVFQQVVLGYHPDLVILGFSCGNDIFENSPALNGRKYLPYLRPAQDGSLTLVPPAPLPLYMRLGQFFHTIPFVYYRLVDGNSRLESLLRGIRRGSTGGTGIPFEYFMYAQTWNDVWEDAWKITQQVLVQFAHDLAEQKITFLIVAIPDHIQVNPAIQQEALALHQAMQQHQWNWEKPNQLLREFCQGQGIPLIDLFPQFQSTITQNGPPLYYHDDGHWNADGHHLAAEIIARQLIERGQLK